MHVSFLTLGWCQLFYCLIHFWLSSIILSWISYDLKLGVAERPVCYHFALRKTWGVGQGSLINIHILLVGMEIQKQHGTGPRRQELMNFPLSFSEVYLTNKNCISLRHMTSIIWYLCYSDDVFSGNNNDILLPISLNSNRIFISM